MLEFLFQMAFEVIGQVIFELVVGVGSESLRDAVGRTRRAHPLLAAIGHFVLGAVAGGVSLLIFAERLTTRGALPGLSLILSPLLTGAAMHVIGARWEQEEHRPTLFSFRAGAICAFGMALVRFLYFEHYLPR